MDVEAYGRYPYYVCNAPNCPVNNIEQGGKKSLERQRADSRHVVIMERCVGALGLAVVLLLVFYKHDLVQAAIMTAILFGFEQLSKYTKRQVWPDLYGKER